MILEVLKVFVLQTTTIAEVDEFFYERHGFLDEM